LIVKPQHWPHLKQQHGRIGAFKDDYPEWCRQYDLSMNRIYKNIEPYLPANIDAAMDIGGGFSGISTLINPRKLTVIDGLDDPPRRAGTSNNELLAREFLGLNGLLNVEYVDPHNSDSIKTKFDLIYSFASYPFHVPPENYFHILKNNAHKDTVFIFEVRRGWTLPLKFIKTIYEEPKYERSIYMA
jgi:hypothetical protein